MDGFGEWKDSEYSQELAVRIWGSSQSSPSSAFERVNEGHKAGNNAALETDPIIWANRRLLTTSRR
jgi:hypothetical protein